VVAKYKESVRAKAQPDFTLNKAAELLGDERTTGT